jgi:hypothetical protein
VRWRTYPHIGYRSSSPFHKVIVCEHPRRGTRISVVLVHLDHIEQRGTNMSHTVLTSPAEDPTEPEKLTSIVAREHFDRQFTPTSLLPDPAAFAMNLTRRTIEVLQGARDITQIARWVTDDVYFSLLDQINARTRKMSLIAPGAKPRTLRDFTLTTVKISEPREGIIEACVMVSGSRRSRAVALRLEGLDNRWRASSFAML